MSSDMRSNGGDAAVRAGVRVEDEHQVRAAAHLDLDENVVGTGFAKRSHAQLAVEGLGAPEVVRGEHHMTDPQLRPLVHHQTGPTTWLLLTVTT